MYFLNQRITLCAADIAMIWRGIIAIGMILFVCLAVDGRAQSGIPLSKRGGIDIDGNNKSVLLVRGTGNASAPVLQVGRFVNGQFQFTPQTVPGSGFRLVGVTDFDGNGKSDLVFQNLMQGELGEVRSWNDFQPANERLLRQVKHVWDVQAVGDLDGDGLGDMVWRYVVSNSADTGVSYIWFTNPTGPPTVRKRGGAPLAWKLMGAVDLNGDGTADMVYVSPDNSIRVLMASSGRTCANYAAGVIPAGFVAQAFADFTGNGRGDILIRNPANGQMALISLNASGIVPPPYTGMPDDPNASCTSTVATIPNISVTLPTSDLTWQLYGTGDFNGDGVFDVVWLRVDGTMAMWQMNRNNAAPTVVANVGNVPAGATNYVVFHGVASARSPTTSFSRIQAKFFAPACNSCHTAGHPFAIQSGLVLDDAVAYRNLVNATVKNIHAVADGMKQVVSRNLEKSLLYQKLLLWDPAKPQNFGSPMPLGATSPSVGQLEYIKQWIEAGALESGDSLDPALLDDKALPSYAPFVPLTPPTSGYQLAIESFLIQPNFERELFVLRELKNPAPIYVSRIETRMRANSHHLLLYTFQNNTPASIIPPANLVRDIRNPDGSLNFVNMLPMGYHSFFAGSMTPEGGYAFPAGVALQLPANTKLDLNAHYANSSTSSIVGEAYVNLHTIPVLQVTQIARTLNLANTTIPLPPMQRTTHSKTFLFSTTTRILMLTSHTHQLGERFVIRIKGGARDGEVVYTNTEWAHPAIVTFDQPIILQAGEGLTSEITYNNTTSSLVSFGLTSLDEMGIIFGYYY